MEAAVVGVVAGVGTGVLGGVGVGVGVGVVSGALTAVVKTYLTAVPPPAEEEPKKAKKKTFVKPEPKKEEESEEEEEKLSAGQKRRLLEKKKKEEAKAKEEEAKKAAAAAKKADKKKGKQPAGKPEAKDNLSAAGAPAIKGGAAPAVKAAAGAPSKSNAAPPAKVSAAEPVVADDGKKKKKKKKSTAAKAADEPVAASSPSAAPVESAAGADEWEQQASQVKEEKRAKIVAEKKKKAEASKAAEGAGSVVEYEEIDKSLFGPIIGKGGATLEKLQEETGCKINMPSKNDASERFIKITGPKHEIDRVRKAFKQLIANGVSDVTHPGVSANEIQIPEGKSGMLVGKGGAVRQAIEGLGVKMKVPEKESGSNLVKLIGSDDAVRNAKQVIQSILDEGFHPITHPGYSKVQVVFPQTHLKHLFGPKGKSLSDLQKNTNTRVTVPPRDERETTGPYANTTIITIVGLAADVEQARFKMSQVAAIVEEDMSPILLKPEPEWAGPSAALSAQNEW